MSARRFFIALMLVLAIGAVVATTATAQTRVVYNNIPTAPPFFHKHMQPRISLNVFSQGAEAYNFVQFGDGFTLKDPDKTLGTVTVIMQSWACQAGNWQNGPGANACVTTPGATYAMPVTVNVYSVTSGTSLEGTPGQPAPGTLLATATESFNMPYRPSSNFVDCPASAYLSSGGYYEWYDAKTQTCQDGINFPITFDLSSQHVELPNQIIVTFSYSTTNFGPSPLGITACNSTVPGCFYDSLNISGAAGAAAYPGAVLAPNVGSVLDVNGIFVEYGPAGGKTGGGGTPQDCAGSTPTADVFALDALPGCFTGNHPMIEVTTKESH